VVGEPPGARIIDVQSSYDRVADEYVRRIAGELAGKPFDRELLDHFANRVRDSGVVCDMGCGPGHVARYLHDRGISICGVDLSPEMVARARSLNPGITFTQGDMRQLAAGDLTWSAIVAFYAIIHIPRADVIRTLRELRRTLIHDGLLLMAFHVGDNRLHLDEWWGYEVNVDFNFFQTKEMVEYLRTAGFAIEEAVERDPYPDVEHQSRRAYLLARRADT
jgi:SAM-dependent methyltransferase